MSRSVQQQLAFEARQREQEWQNEQCLCAYDTYLSYAKYNWLTWSPLSGGDASYTTWMDDSGYIWYALLSFKTVFYIACIGRNNILFFDLHPHTSQYAHSSRMHVAKFRRLILDSPIAFDKHICYTYTRRPMR